MQTTEHPFNSVIDLGTHPGGDKVNIQCKECKKKAEYIVGQELAFCYNHFLKWKKELKAK